MVISYNINKLTGGQKMNTVLKDYAENRVKELIADINYYINNGCEKHTAIFNVLSDSCLSQRWKNKVLDYFKF